MSLTKLVSVLEKMGLDMADVSDVLADVVSRLSEPRQERPSVLPFEPVKQRTPADRSREYRARQASRRASHSVTEECDASRDGVTVSVTERDGKRDGKRDGVTPRAGIRALKSLSFSEETAEEESTGARASRSVTETVTASVTHGVTPSVTRDGEKSVTASVTASALTDKAETVRTALEAGFRSRKLPIPTRYLSVPHSREVLELAKGVSQEDLPRLVDGFFADAGAKAKGYPIAWLVTNPAQYVSQKPSVDVLKLPMPPTLTEAEKKAVSAHKGVLRNPPGMWHGPTPDPEALKAALQKMAEAHMGAS